jgi:hypothetical protein
MMTIRDMASTRTALGALKPLLHSSSSLDSTEKANLTTIIDATLATLRKHHNPLHQPTHYCTRLFHTPDILRDAMVVVQNVEAAVSLAPQRTEWKRQNCLT